MPERQSQDMEERMPDFFEVLRTRRTVRSYTEEPVGDDDLKDIIDLAVLAPSGMNLQPWNFIVVTNQQVIAELNARVKEILREQNIAVRVKSEGFKAALNNPEYSLFHGAPALVVITADKAAPVAKIDSQLAIENLFLAAHAKGLGTCYIGWLFFGAEDPQVRRALRIPEGHEITAAAIVGHPQTMPQGPPKRNPPRIEWLR
jgi:nitroreductase